MSAGEWTFLSNYGHVLACLAIDPQLRMREVAEKVGVTERAVQHIVHELVERGYVEKDKAGRRNCYRIVRSAHFRHPLESGISIGDFVDLVLDATTR